MCEILDYLFSIFKPNFKNWNFLQINTCIYLNKKIEFCGGYIRCQVYEMWSSGVRVACGVITENTKVS